MFLNIVFCIISTNSRQIIVMTTLRLNIISLVIANTNKTQPSSRYHLPFVTREGSEWR